MEINGVAPIQLTAGDFARARAFYARLLPFLGMTCVMDVPGFYYCVGGRTGCRRRGGVDRLWRRRRGAGDEQRQQEGMEQSYRLLGQGYLRISGEHTTAEHTTAELVRQVTSPQDRDSPDGREQAERDQQPPAGQCGSRGGDIATDLPDAEEAALTL